MEQRSSKLHIKLWCPTNKLEFNITFAPHPLYSIKYFILGSQIQCKHDKNKKNKQINNTSIAILS